LKIRSCRGIILTQALNYVLTYEVLVGREYSDYINDIRIAIDKIESFIEGLSYEDFIRDEKTLYAIVRALEIIGEAAKKVPEDIRKETEEIPWKDMSGMRDVLVHDYINVDVETVWLTAKQKVPQLKRLLEQYTRGER
jgi:uncharacterized protein with HEPN domain